MAATNATHTYAHDVAAVSPHAHIHIPILTYTLSRVLRFRLFTTTDVDRRRTAGCCFSRFVCSVRSPRRTSVAGVRRLLLPHHLRGNACPPRCVCRHVSVLERRPAFLGAGAEVGPRTLCCACAPPLDRVRWCTLSPRMLECACASLFDRVPGSTLVYARPAHNLLRVRFSARALRPRGMWTPPPSIGHASRENAKDHKIYPNPGERLRGVLDTIESLNPAQRKRPGVAVAHP